MNCDSKTVSVAIVDDDPAVGRMLARYLKGMDCGIAVYTEPGQCLAAIRAQPVDILIADIRMPGMDGLTLLGKAKEISPTMDVVLITSLADKDSAVRALKLGAFDLFEKPVNREEFVETVKRTVRYRTLASERDRLAKQLSHMSQQEGKRWGLAGFVGESPAIREVLRQVRSVSQTAGTPVLIIGESGTGKELLARAIHFGGPRAERPFIPVNCSALPPDLAESALFGHTKGAFTGANADKAGSFELAHGGTLFLDEIGDMPVSVQPKLLRVLEDGIVMPVGKSAGRRVDVRVIAATNADLKKRVEEGSFRADLFYRLAGFMIEVTPIRERREDIPLLVRHFVQRLSSEMGLPQPSLDPDALDSLEKYDYPGNVRELKNLIERALIESAGKSIGARHLLFLNVRSNKSSNGRPSAPASADGGGFVQVPLVLKQAEEALIRRALDISGGNISKAARLLGTTRQRLHRKISAG